MDDINIADNEESRMQYRKQLDAERRKRVNTNANALKLMQSKLSSKVVNILVDETN